MGFEGAFRLGDGSIGRFQVTARNVSRGGVAVLHAAFVEPSSRCDLILPTRTGEMIAAPGTVRGCRTVSFVLHEIGIEFDEPLDERSFADLALIDS